MVELPLGEFIMGAPEDEFRRAVVYRDGALRLATEEHPYVKEDEGPQHRVVMDMPIAMGRTEITLKHWMVCIADGGCGEHVPFEILYQYEQGLQDLADIEDLPLTHVSVDDAEAYIAWLNGRLGTTAYRLPTEAEWEYAARAGTTTRFAQGETITTDQANFDGEWTAVVLNAPQPHLIKRGQTVEVHALDAANAWGLRHMSGNVAEYTRSCYTARYAGWATASEWLEKSYVPGCNLVERGGHWNSSMDHVRVAYRWPVDYPDLRLSTHGFRVLKDLVAE